MSKSKKYISYDYESVYKNDIVNLHEWVVEQILNKPHSCVYACKEYYMKEQLEINIYPEFSRKSELPEGAKLRRDNLRAQANLNDINARKYVERLILLNFDDGDYWVTFTYDEEHIPQDMDEAVKNFRNFIRRVNNRRKKRGMDNAKYIYITEYAPDEAMRYHHHLIMDNGISMQELESIWGMSSRNTLRSLQKDDNGLIGLSRYITKERHKGKKRWNSSKGNLLPVRPRKNHYKFRKKQVDEMIRNQSAIKEKMESVYKDYIFTEQKIYFNDFNGKFYINVRMRKKKRKMLRANGSRQEGIHEKIFC